MQKEIKFQQEGKISTEEICATTWKELYHFIYCRVQSHEEDKNVTQERIYGN